jgi:hypothetical protein
MIGHWQCAKYAEAIKTWRRTMQPQSRHKENRRVASNYGNTHLHHDWTIEVLGLVAS